MKTIVLSSSNQTVKYSPAYKKSRDTLNVALNIVICLVVTILSSFNPIAIALAYISYDAVTIFLNRCIVKSNVKQIRKIQNLKKNSVNFDFVYKDEYSNYSKYFEDCFDYELKLAKEYIQLEVQKQKEEKKVEKLISKREEHQTAILNDCCDKIINYNYQHNNIDEDLYCKIIKRVKKLQKLITDNPEYYVFVDTTYKTYTQELIELLNAFKGFDENISKENQEKCDELLEKFIVYLDKTIDKIIQHNDMIIETSYDVLLKNLEQE